jgi:putative salt-induced outer membrane protein
MQQRFCVLFAALAATTIVNVAALMIAPARADWTGKGEAGLVISSGNTETKTANAKLALARESGNWKNAFGLAGLYAADDVGRTAQRWEALTQSDYNFSPQTFWFGAARYEDDEFSGFQYQATLSTGLGRKFINVDRTKFTGTAGVGYKVLETRDAFDDAGVLITPGERETDAILRGTLDFDHKLTGNTTIINKFIVESGSNNTYLQNELSLQVKMMEALALAVGYAVRHNTDPPSGFEKTDTLTTINLVYEIK